MTKGGGEVGVQMRIRRRAWVGAGPTALRRRLYSKSGEKLRQERLVLQF